MLANIPSIPPQFGGCWAAFLENWCLGNALAVSRIEVARSLSTLVRLWPDRAGRLVSESARGPAVIAPVVELGLLLYSCEPVASFDRVWQRLIGGERSAYSELVVVAALRRLGYKAEFAPPIGGRVLDAKSVIDGVPVYFEVVAPERSDASTKEQQLVRQLTRELRESLSNCRVEIEIFSTIDGAAIGQIAAAVQSAEPSVWTIVESVGRVSRTELGQSLPPQFDREGAQIVVGGERAVQGASTNIVAQWESSDRRAKRIFNEKYPQLGKDVANVLVVDVCAIPGGMGDWPHQMIPLLQPSRNRKVGAVAFFDQSCVGSPEAIRGRWRVLVNSHAHVPIPEVLLTGLESLDESQWHGLARPERLVAV